jgi:ribosome-associated heat shock protein Hsp15
MALRAEAGSHPTNQAAESTRLDVWLDLSCLFKTRSDAQRACRAGQVEVNGVCAKPHRALKSGDTLRIARGQGRQQTVVVRGFASHHVAKAAARALYDDLTPPPSPEELEARRIERLLRQSAPPPVAAPHRRDRRELRRLRGKS